MRKLNKKEINEIAVVLSHCMEDLNRGSDGTFADKINNEIVDSKEAVSAIKGMDLIQKLLKDNQKQCN